MIVTVTARFQFVTLSEVSVTRSIWLIAGRVQGVGEGLHHEAACQGSDGETGEISSLVVYIPGFG